MDLEEIEKDQRSLDVSEVNPKLRCFYVEKMKIEPFYNGGKVVFLHTHLIACHCGSGVKLVSLSSELSKPPETDDKHQDSHAIDETDSSHFSHKGFQILYHFEVEFDDIVSFDACWHAKVLVTAHKSSLIRVWDLEEFKILKTIKFQTSVPVSSIEIYPNSSMLLPSDDLPVPNSLAWAVVAGSNLKIFLRIGDIVSKLIRVSNAPKIPFLKWGRNLTVYAAERDIAVVKGTADGNFNIECRLTGHYSQVTGIEEMENDNVIVSGARDKVLIIWDSRSYEKLKTVTVSHSIEALLPLSQDMILLTLHPSVLKCYEMSSSCVTDLICLDQEEIATGLYRDISSTAQEHVKDILLSSHTCNLYHLEFENVQSGKIIINQYAGNLDEVLDMALLSPKKVAVATNSSIIKLYDLDTGGCEFLKCHTDIVLTLSCNQKWLVSGSKDNNIALWEIGALKPIVVLSGHLASVSAICISPVHDVLYSAAEDNFLKCWDFTKCTNSVVAHSKEINAVTCSPNGALVATGSRDKTAKVWDGTSLGLVSTLTGHKKGIWDIKFSQWDQLLVTSSADASIRIWTLMSYECIKTLQGHQSSVLQSCFFNNGLQILSTSSDGTLKCWDIKTSLCISTYECGDGKVWALQCNDEGSTVITGTSDSNLTIWSDVTEEKLTEYQNAKQKELEDEQTLANVMRSGKWKNAILLAIHLDRPFSLLKIIRETPSEELLRDVIKDLNKSETRRVLTYVKKWNTNTKTAMEAQTVLNLILREKTPNELEHLEIDALMAYTDRHFERYGRHMQSIIMLKRLTDKELLT